MLLHVACTLRCTRYRAIGRAYNYIDKIKRVYAHHSNVIYTLSFRRVVMSRKTESLRSSLARSSRAINATMSVPHPRPVTSASVSFLSSFSSYFSPLLFLILRVSPLAGCIAYASSHARHTLPIFSTGLYVPATGSVSSSLSLSLPPIISLYARLHRSVTTTTNRRTGLARPCPCSSNKKVATSSSLSHRAPYLSYTY